jgi:disulfide bond formation protein DsbB
MSLACPRSLFFIVFIAGALALGVSYYLEYAVGLQPCGLCLLQRACLALLTGLCLMASVHGPGRLGGFVYWLLGLLCSLLGTFTAWRQVLLQTDPVYQFSACSPDLAEVFTRAPWQGFLQMMFQGAVDCPRIAWTLFDLSIPEWSLLFFVAVMIPAIYQLVRLVLSVSRRPLGGESSPRVLAGD